jgi:hypothetical protein
MWDEEEERKQTGKLKQWLGQTNEKGKGTNEKRGRHIKKELLSANRDSRRDGKKKNVRRKRRSKNKREQ